MFECVFPILCRGDLRAVEETVKMADEWQQSWMYWQFKYFQVALHTYRCLYARLTTILSCAGHHHLHTAGREPLQRGRVSVHRLG